MAINQQPLPNGLQLINTGIVPGDGLGDPYYVVFDKINSNSTITLTKNDDLAGTGLAWNATQRKLSLNIPDGKLLVGTSTFSLSNEFSTVGGLFSINSIAASKIVGTLLPGQLSLPHNNLLVGNSSNVPVATTFSNEFKIESNQLKINKIDFSKIENFSVVTGTLTLAQNKLLVGNDQNKAAEVELGEEFSITDGKLHVTVQSSSPTNPDQLVTLTLTENSVDIQHINASGRAKNKVLQINATNTGLVWSDVLINPNLDQDLTALNSYLNHINSTQRYTNIKLGRSLAQLQNQNSEIEVFNTPLPSAYKALLGSSNIPTVDSEFPIYILGGATRVDFNLSCTNFSPTLETYKIISSTLSQRKPEAYSISATDTFGYAMGGTHTNNKIEKLTYSTETIAALSTNISTPRHAASTTKSSSHGFVVGGINRSANPSLVRAIAKIAFSDDSTTNSGTQLSTGDALYAGQSATTSTHGYFFGGRTDSAFNPRCLSFHLASETITLLFTALGMQVTVDGHLASMASCQSSTDAYLVGGAVDANIRSSRVSKFNFASNTLSLVGEALTSSHSSQAGGNAKSKGYIFGGIQSYIYQQPQKNQASDFINYKVRNVLRK